MRSLVASACLKIARLEFAARWRADADPGVFATSAAMARVSKGATEHPGYCWSCSAHERRDIVSVLVWRKKRCASASLGSPSFFETLAVNNERFHIGKAAAYYVFSHRCHGQVVVAALVAGCAGNQHRAHRNPPRYYSMCTCNRGRHEFPGPVFWGIH
jgi:hypothetical protein